MAKTKNPEIMEAEIRKDLSFCYTYSPSGLAADMRWVFQAMSFGDIRDAYIYVLERRLAGATRAE